MRSSSPNGFVFLSMEWMEELNRQLQQDSALSRLSDGVDFIGEVNVEDAPRGLLNCYTFVAQSGSAGVLAGPHPYPDVTIRYRYETAKLIAVGHLSQPHARRSGLMRVAGDYAKLTASESISSRFAFLLTQVRLLDPPAHPPGPAVGR